MEQQLKQGESSNFQLGKDDFILVQNCVVIDGNGVASVATVQQKIGPFSLGANLRVIGGAGGGSVDVVDYAYDDRAIVARDSAGAISGLIDPRDGSTVPLAGIAAGVTRGPFSLSIPLNGNKAMPETFGQRVAVSAPITLLAPLFSAMVDGGVCSVSFRVATGGSVDDSAFQRTGLAMDAGYDYDAVFLAGSPPRSIVVRGAAVAAPAPSPAPAPAPAFTDQTVAPGTVGVAYSDGYAASNATSFAVFSGSLPAGLTLNAATGALTGTPTTAATSSFVVSATGPGGTTNSTAQNVVVGAATTAPGQVTGLTAGTATSTTQPLTWAAPASNGGSGFTDYLIEYKLAAAGTYTAFTHSASTVTAIVVTGLTASQSYNFRVSAINAVGTGAASSVVTSSTGAAAAMRTDNFDRANGLVSAGTPSDGGASWIEDFPGAQQLTITSNSLRSIGNYADSQGYLPFSAADSITSVTFTNVLNFGSTLIGLMVRHKAGTSGDCVRFLIDSTNVFIQRRFAGGTLDLAGPFTHGLASGASITVSVEAQGTSIVGKINGVTLATATTTFNQTETGCGIVLASGEWTADNFSITGY